MDIKTVVELLPRLMRGLSDALFCAVGLPLIFLALDRLANKFRFIAVPAAAAIMGITAVVMIDRGNTGSTTVWYLSTGFSMAAVVFIMRFFRYKLLDYAVILAGFILTKVFSHSYYFGEAPTMIFVFCVITAVTKIRLGTLKGNLFYVWFSSLLVSLAGYVFGYVFDRYVRMIGYTFSSGLAKLAVWGTAVLAAVIINLALVYGIKRLFGRRFNEVNDMGRRYPHIERYFITSTVIILAVIGAVHFAFIALGQFNFLTSYDLLFNIFALFALAIQLSFLILLFRLTWLKDSLKSKDRENISLAAYSSGLEKNIDDIRNLKHDIKNIFLTMANFVEKSGDEDMKAFYREKISPFAEDEIQKSDLYAKLSKIGEERLKAFLFYKISQIIARGIALELEIAPYFNSETGLEFTDLIRILGILLDNAAEECMELKDGVINVKLSLNGEFAAYTIRNSVRSETRDKGIRPGVSSKGKERGRGLVIVRDIIGKYDAVSLNSYFARDGFVQSLVCYR